MRGSQWRLRPVAEPPRAPEPEREPPGRSPVRDGIHGRALQFHLPRRRGQRLSKRDHYTRDPGSRVRKHRLGRVSAERRLVRAVPYEDSDKEVKAADRLM